MKIPAAILARLAELIQHGQFTELETESIEIKPVPATGADWKEIQKSVNAFLNSRGGILILGVREEGTGPSRRYVLDGWEDHAEPNLMEFPRLFTDRKGVKQDLGDCFPHMEILPILDGRVVVVYVDDLAADRKFVFFNGTAYRRLLTGDHKLTDREVEAQEEFKEEAAHAKELQPVPDMSEADLDLTKLNEFIFHLNQPKQVETLKPGNPCLHSQSGSIPADPHHRGWRCCNPGAADPSGSKTPQPQAGRRATGLPEMGGQRLRDVHTGQLMPGYDRRGAAGDIKEFDTFYRKIRYLFNKLEKGGYLQKVDATRGYVLREDRQQSHLI